MTAGPDKMQVINNIRYAVAYGERCKSWYEFLSNVFSFVEIVNGMSAIAALIGQSAIAGTVVAVVVAITTALNKTIKPAHKAARCEVVVAHYRHLLAQSGSLAAATLDARLQALHAEKRPSGIRALLLIVHHETNDRFGWHMQIPPMRWYHTLINAVT